MIGFGQGTGNGLVWPLRRLRLQEDVDSLLEAAAQQVVVAVKGDEPALRHARLVGQMEAVNGVQEEQGAHTLIEVAAGPPQGIQLGALGQQLIQRRRPAKGIHRAVAHLGIGRGDDRR